MIKINKLIKINKSIKNPGERHFRAGILFKSADSQQPRKEKDKTGLDQFQEMHTGVWVRAPKRKRRKYRIDMQLKMRAPK